LPANDPTIGPSDEEPIDVSNPEKRTRAKIELRAGTTRSLLDRYADVGSTLAFRCFP
jgi:hypothetical protein